MQTTQSYRSTDRSRYAYERAATLIGAAQDAESLGRYVLATAYRERAAETLERIGRHSQAARVRAACRWSRN